MRGFDPSTPRERGAILLFTLFLMSLLMIVGIGGILYTSITIAISGSLERAQRYSLTAEAGVEHARALLRREEGGWDLVLRCFAGEQNGCDAIAGDVAGLRSGVRLDEGVYRVELMDNDDGDDDPLSDEDGVVLVRSSGYMGTKRMCSLEVLIGRDPIRTLAWRELLD